MRKVLVSLTIALVISMVPAACFANTSVEGKAIIVPIGSSFETSAEWDVPFEEKIVKAPAGSYTTSKIIDTYTLANRFIGYNSNTPDWSYASGYTLRTGKTYNFSATIATKWGESTVKAAYKVGGADIHFKADSKRASRLAAKSDVKVDKVKYTQYVNGKVVKTWTGLSSKAVGAKTNYVAYR